VISVITEGQANFVTRFTEDRSRGIVVLASDQGKPGNFSAAIDELNSVEARNKALGFANAHGVGDARINGSPGSPYAVNREGIPLENVRDEHGQTIPLTDPRMHVRGYHIEIPVTRRLV